MDIQLWCRIVPILLCVRDVSSSLVTEYDLTAHPNIRQTIYSPLNRVTHPITGTSVVAYHYECNITYTIKSKVPGQPIQTDLILLDLPTGCNDDSLEIWDHDKLLYRGCNSEKSKRTFQSHTDTVTVRFMSNNDGNDYRFGFLLEYMSIGDSGCNGAADIKNVLVFKVVLAVIAVFALGCS